MKPVQLELLLFLGGCLWLLYGGEQECKVVWGSNEEAVEAVSYTHLTLPTTGSLCRSRWSPYH